MILERLDVFLKHQGVSYYKLENSLNVSNGSISKAVKSGKNIGSNVIEKILENFPELNVEWLLTGRGEMIKFKDELLKEPSDTYLLRTDVSRQIQSIPLYDMEASAGLVGLFDQMNENRPIDYLSIPNLPKCDGAVYVTGDSMYPLLKSGDIVIYKQIKNIEDGIFWGEMYLLAITLDDEEYITVKYIQRSDKGENYIKLVSQNGHHQPKDILKSHIRALAMVKASVRINAMR